MVDTGQLQAAIDANRLISFTYTDREGNITFRQGEPYELRVGQGTDIFVWDIDKDEIRRFKTMRMTNLQILEDIFSPRF